MHQQPMKTKEQRVLELLHSRKSLTTDEIQRLKTLQKGFHGEQKFYQLLKKAPIAHSFLFDLLFESDGTTFQLDSVYVNGNSITIFEIKNYTGDFYIDKDKWFIAPTHQEIRSPITQLQRSEFLLRKLLRQSHPELLLHSRLIFIHDEFTLYNAPLDLPATLPTQITRFFKRITSNHSGTPPRNTSLAEHLTSLHIANSPFDRLPTYSYEELQKGLTCPLLCGGFLERYTNKSFICKKCKHAQLTASALYENILELTELFPNKSITTQLVYDWCDKLVVKNTIRDTLLKHFKHIPNGKHSYYVLK